MPLILILVLGCYFAYLFSVRAATNAYDLGLLDDALDLSKQIEMRHGAMTINLPLAAKQMLEANNEDRVSYAAWDESGKLFSGTSKLLRYGAMPIGETHLFRDIILDGEVCRAVVLSGEVEGRKYFIAVSQTTHGRDHLTDGILARIVVPEAGLVLVSIAAILFGVRRGLSPIESLRNEISSRSSSDLRRIEETSAPSELIPVIHGINELLGKLSTAFASHRRFIADAAHQLRTPLASLSSQIEVSMESPPQDMAGLLKQLHRTTLRTTHLANQLLSLARLEHTEQFMYEVVAVDLQQVFIEASADIVTLAARKGVELNFDFQPARIRGSPLLLRELLLNLLDNAVRYTPPGGRVAVSLQIDQQDISLVVEDNGPGVPEDQLAMLGIPFHRLPSNYPEGCGLGLAIVREIVRLHGAEIQFGRGADSIGLRVQVEFHRGLALIS